MWLKCTSALYIVTLIWIYLLDYEAFIWKYKSTFQKKMSASLRQYCMNFLSYCFLFLRSYLQFVWPFAGDLLEDRLSVGAKLTPGGPRDRDGHLRTGQLLELHGPCAGLQHRRGRPLQSPAVWPHWAVEYVLLRTLFIIEQLEILFFKLLVNLVFVDVLNYHRMSRNFRGRKIKPFINLKFEKLFLSKNSLSNF